MEIINVKNLCKEFKVYKREKGLANSIKSLFIRKFENVKAVKDISFAINRGELVGYIGPNGAGKSTTIKMLSGILVPSSGVINVAGRVPFQDRKKNALNIGVVFGQRSQLYWDLPVMDTFDLYKKMYRVDDRKYKKNVDLFMELLGLKDFFKTPVRQLSLGQKMRANIAIALLHEPEILYLDEPTIGLDVVAKNSIRKFIKKINNEKKTTVILTTHDMDDIEQICNRIFLINKGELLYNGEIEKFKEQYGEGYILIVDFVAENCSFSHLYLKVIKEEGNRKTILFSKENISVVEAVTYITHNYEIVDLQFKAPDIEEIVRKIYQGS